MVITLREQTEQDLFDGAPTNALEQIDIKASIVAFERVWANRVRESYPNAEIQWTANQRAHASIDTTGDDYSPEEYHGEMEQDIQSLAESLFDDGNLWMVERS